MSNKPLRFSLLPFSIAILLFVEFSQVNADNFSLEKPEFVAAKMAATAQDTGSAFPADKAGMAAYAKVDQMIDIEGIASIFSEVIEKGDNFILGIIPISNFGGSIDVRLYADIDGWIIAFFEKDEQTAKMMQWLPADTNNPQISTIPRNVLTDALNETGDKAGVGFLPEIKYYNFKYPNATNLTIFVKTTASDGKNLTQVEIPADYALYEASYYLYAFDAMSAELIVDGTLITKAVTGNNSGAKVIGSYKGAIKTGILHTIEISYSGIDANYSDSKIGSSGVATALLYKSTE